jgi:hypothetical protein
MDRRVKDWMLGHALEMVVDSAGLQWTSSTSCVEPSVLADCVPRWLTSQDVSHRRRRKAYASSGRARPE